MARTLAVSQLRLATALARTIPGVTLELGGRDGDAMTVAYDRLDADLTPCQLRTALLDEGRAHTRVLEMVTAVRIGPGLEHLGGGLYRRGSPTSEERWFATFLDVEASTALFERCEIDVPPESMNVTLRPDAQLAVTVVRIAASDPRLGFRLDEVGFWSLAACMVEEIDHAVARVARRPTNKP